MDLKTLQTIIAIADHGSFVEASEAVNLSQSAVSLRIRALEETLGFALFDRRKRPPGLNTEGRAFVAKARGLVEHWEQLTGAFSSPPRLRRLSFGVIPTSLCGLVPPSLRLLCRSQPSLQLRLSTDLSDVLQDRVLRQELDCALVTEFASFAPEIVWRPLASEAFVVIAPQDLTADSGIEALTKAPYIRFKRFAWAGRLIEQEIERAGIPLQAAMEVDTLDGISLLVASGLGVSVVPSRPKTNPFPENVRVMAFGDPPVARVIGLIERADNPRANVSRLLFEACQSTAADIYPS